MRALLVAPRMPMTYWGFQYSLPFIGKRASQIPLGLVTVAALLPDRWQLRLVDLNVRRLHDRDLRWSDVVLTGGMLCQLSSIEDIICRSRRADRQVVVGGPAAGSPERLHGAAVVFQGEAEGRIPELVRALADPTAEPQVLAPEPDAHPDMSASPIPRYDLLEIGRYASMGVQYSRGCPYNCEFCDVVQLLGRRPRVKSPHQVVAELDALHTVGYRGSVFFVDDNFIGNRRSVRELLPRIAAWQEEHSRPFELYTEASIDLAAHRQLMRSMVAAGFTSVFLGLESPSTSALEEAGKTQNLRTDMTASIDRLTRAGLQVMGGFIVGFDADKPSIFDAQRQLIGSSPIPLAMVGLLSALPGTALWRRLAGEQRLREEPTGDQFGRPNFVPTMDEQTLLEGYAALLEEIYSPRGYYRRCATWAERTGRTPRVHGRATADIKALVRAFLHLGVLGRRRWYFWGLLARCLTRAPHTVRHAVVMAIKGEHMIRYTERHVLPRIREALAELDAERRCAADVAG